MKAKNTKLILDCLYQMTANDAMKPNAKEAVENSIKLIDILYSDINDSEKISRMLNIFEDEKPNPIDATIRMIKAKNDYNAKLTNIAVSGLNALRKIEEELCTDYDDMQIVFDITDIISDFKYENDIKE